jgi:hypothetical protein
VPVWCDDKNPCTKDVCDPTLEACFHQPLDNCQPTVDADADGSPSGEDCDDNDPARHPFAVEACDGIDNDCDGEVDEFVPNQCPEGLLCIEAQCTQATPGECDNNPCTADATLPGGECIVVHFNEGLVCGEATACEGPAQCVGNECVPGKPIECKDTDPCTQDACVPETGCIFTPIEGCTP